MVNVQGYCFLTSIITKTKICESETTFFNFVKLPKREKAPLNLTHFQERYLKDILYSRESMAQNSH